jgi:hypothetical protein
MMRTTVDYAPVRRRGHPVAIERDSAAPAGGTPAPAFTRGLVAPSSLLELQRSHGNRFVQRLLARRAGARPARPIQRAVTRAPDGAIGEAGWKSFAPGGYAWKAGAEERWNAIEAMYGELEALDQQLPGVATQHDNHPRIRRARYAIWKYTIGDHVIAFDQSGAVLADMTGLRDRARGVIAAPPAADSPGQLTPQVTLAVEDKPTKKKKESVGAFETRQKTNETKQHVNRMFGHMDEADRAHGQAKTVWGRHKASKATQGTQGTSAADLAEDLEDARLYVKDAWRAQQEARYYWRKANEHPYNTTMGLPNDRDVEAALKRYNVWWKTFGKELTALDRLLFTTDKPKPGNLTIASLENDKPDLFRTLVLLGKLTVAGGNTYKKGGNKTFAINETKDWELHVHEESTTSYQRGRFTAHYKPMSDKYGLGYNSRNPVDMATLHALGVDIS